jgi:hypothetical protein
LKQHFERSGLTVRDVANDGQPDAKIEIEFDNLELGCLSLLTKFHLCAKDSTPSSWESCDKTTVHPLDVIVRGENMAIDLPIGKL